MSPHRARSPKFKLCGTAYDNGPPPHLKDMSNSERGKYYRRRRKLYAAHLKKCTAELRDEIAALTISRQVQHELTLSVRCTPLGAAARIVSEYCRLFCHGTPVHLAVDEPSASMALVARATSAQRGFLTAVMTENVRFGEYTGAHLVLNQWERYSLYHAAIGWRMKSLRIAQVTEPHVIMDNRYDGGLVDVVITAELRVRFSRRTVEEIFPHLLSDEALTQALIGLEVAYPVVNWFRFNGCGKIEWYMPEVEFVGTMMTALAVPELVVRVLDHAIIRKEHMIGDESDGRQLVVDEVVGDDELPTLSDLSKGPG